MITRIGCICSGCSDPYYNLALEEELLYSVDDTECILYLWQNNNTVVIGRNQSARAECRIDELETDGGLLARRLSGGGAVYHDIGNLNFSFMTKGENSDVTKQTEVILRAVSSLGIDVYKSGRNDLTVENGRKFSGNAYYNGDGRSLHHGTLLVSTDMTAMSRYLNVPADKLKSKGVGSVRSRVVNLSELDPTVTVERLKAAMVISFGREYGLSPQLIPPDRINEGQLRNRRERLASRKWRLEREPQLSCHTSGRFDWGGVELGLTVSDGSIADVVMYTDALETDIVRAVTGALLHIEFTPNAVAEAFSGIKGYGAEIIEMIRDVSKLTEELFL